MPRPRFSDPAPPNDNNLPPIVLAAQSEDCVTAARRYAALGLSVLPLRGKQPALRSWKAYQDSPAPLRMIDAWARAGLFGNVGIVCGEVSGGLVILDLDGKAAYLAFADNYPQLTDTFTVTTGSGVSHHVYYIAKQQPPPIRALRTPLGNVEIRSTGQQVVAPPSTHPRTGRPYTVMRPLDLLRVPDLDGVGEWIEQFRSEAIQTGRRRTSRSMQTQSSPAATINPALVDAIANHFRGLGYREKGDWLNGQCIYPERHTNHDLHISFGFNTRTGYGYCFRCGSILARDIALRAGIDPQQYGGIINHDRPSK